MPPLFCTKDYESFKRPCPVIRQNSTNPFAEDSEVIDLLWSPVLMVTAVVCVIFALSCVTIMMNTRRSRKQEEDSEEDEEEDEEPDEPSYWSLGMRYACSLVGSSSDGEVDLGSDEEVDGTEREMYTDYPPCYEECTEPGATQLYRPMESPPSYWLIDTCFTDGRFHLRTISLDLPPSYESVCGACPPAPSSLLPLPGPNVIDTPPTPSRAVISSAEISV